MDNSAPVAPSCPKEEDAASWGFAPPARGLRPPRIAARSSHPASPLMSRLRRHAFADWDIARRSRTYRRHTAKPNRRNGFPEKPSGYVSAPIERAGQAETSLQGDFRAVQRDSGSRTWFRAAEPPMALYGFPSGRFFRREIHDPSGYSPTAARYTNGEPIPQNSPFARQSAISRAFGRSRRGIICGGTPSYRYRLYIGMMALRQIEVV